ncbi:MAG TPA: ABC transporter permease subunit [Stellaceae bacterium]|nr:ABC transporter permease subunit [Stellaceae bacterium]
MTDLPVLRRVGPLAGFRAPLALPALPLAAALFFVASLAWAQTRSAPVGESAAAAVLRWAPLIFGGFLFNVLVSVLSMAVGTALGFALGLLLIAPTRLPRGVGWALTQFFRNAPWLVLLFYAMFLLPFELHLGGLEIPLPSWAKAVLGLSLPVAANFAEIVRGALQSIPEPQWSAARGLAFGPLQTIRLVILPQAVRRMLPPWMNLYAILTMATTLISVVGIQDGLTITRAAIASDARPELMLPLYLFLLLLFFVYCYPIARATLALERRFQVRG